MKKIRILALLAGFILNLLPPPSDAEAPPCDCYYSEHLILSCTGEFPLDEGYFKISFIPGELKPQGCEPIACDQAIAECTVYCGGFQPKSASPCNGLTASIIAEISRCVARQASDFFCLRPDDKDPGGLFLESREPFYCCFCSWEAGIPCDGTQGLPIGACPIYNLCDGIAGNETRDWEDFHSGLGIECLPAMCPDSTPTPSATSTDTPTDTLTSTPTQTPTDTPKDTPSNTPTDAPTDSPTVTPTDTRTETATETVTETYTETVTATPTDTPSCECLYAEHLVLSCTGEFPFDEGYFKIRLIPGELKQQDCEPIACDQAIAECTIYCGELAGKSVGSCDGLVSSIITEISQCLARQASSLICVRLDEKEPGGLFLESREPFHCCLCSWEAGIPCDTTLGLPLGNCPIYNLCDGIAENETRDPEDFTSGLGLFCEPAYCPGTTPTPTETATETSTATVTDSPTYTASPTSTLSPTHTVTETATVTATSTATDTPSPTWTVTHTETPTHTLTVTNTVTPTSTATSTATATASASPSATVTLTPTEAPTSTKTPSSSPTPTHTEIAKVVCSATFTLSCTETLNTFGGPFGLRLMPGLLNSHGCEAVLCSAKDIILGCTWTCPEFDEETKPTCLAALSAITDQLLACLSGRPEVYVQLVSLDDNAAVINVQANFECHWCICGASLDFPCDGDLALPLGPCQPTGLCDGINLGFEERLIVQGCQPCDLNCDGNVDAADIFLFLNQPAKLGEEPYLFEFIREWGAGQP